MTYRLLTKHIKYDCPVQSSGNTSPEQGGVTVCFVEKRRSAYWLMRVGTMEQWKAFFGGSRESHVDPQERADRHTKFSFCAISFTYVQLLFYNFGVV